MPGVQLLTVPLILKEIILDWRSLLLFKHITNMRLAVGSIESVSPTFGKYYEWHVNPKSQIVVSTYVYRCVDKGLTNNNRIFKVNKNSFQRIYKYVSQLKNFNDDLNLQFRDTKVFTLSVGDTYKSDNSTKTIIEIENKDHVKLIDGSNVLPRKEIVYELLHANIKEVSEWIHADKDRVHAEIIKIVNMAQFKFSK